MSDWFVVLPVPPHWGWRHSRVCRGGAWSADIGLAHSTTRAVACAHQATRSADALPNAVTQYRCVVLMVLTCVLLLAVGAAPRPDDPPPRLPHRALHRKHPPNMTYPMSIQELPESSSTQEMAFVFPFGGLRRRTPGPPFSCHELDTRAPGIIQSSLCRSLLSV